MFCAVHWLGKTEMISEPFAAEESFQGCDYFFIARWFSGFVKNISSSLLHSLFPVLFLFLPVFYNSDR